jgi:hypothetical protein
MFQTDRRPSGDWLISGYPTMSDAFTIAAGVLLANLMTAMFLYGCWQLRGLSVDEAGEKFVALGCMAFPLIWVAVMLMVAA